jgi:trigger factor
VEDCTLNVTVERTPESEAVLTVQLEWAEVEKAAERVYQRLAQKHTIPGFRKGHAPRSMIERMFGKEAIYHEGLDDLIQESYRQALRQHDLTPIDQPTVDEPEIETGQPYTFTVRVPILTPAKLGDYHTIRGAQPPVVVTDEDVAQALENMRQNAALWVPVERAAAVDDQVLVDLALTVGDKTVSDLHDHEFVLTQDRPGILAGLDQHLSGMCEGESGEFTTTIPEDYSNPAFAGKEGRYTVTVKAVKHRELPELDDEFAKSEGQPEGRYQTLDELRDAVRQQLERQKQSEARSELREQVVKAVTEQAEVAIHPVLVADEVEAMLRETDRVLGQNRLSLEQYLGMMQKSEAEYRKEIEPEARERVKRDLVLSAVADAENITVSDDEIEEWLQVLTALGGKPTRPRQMSDRQRASIASRMRRDKALERLIEIATGESAAGAEGGEAHGEPAAAADLELAQREAQGVLVEDAAALREAEANQATQTAQASRTSQVPPASGMASAVAPAPPAPPAASVSEPASAQLLDAEAAATLVRGAQEAARLGAELGGGRAAPDALEVSESLADRAPPASQEAPMSKTPESEQPQAFGASGTEVPKSGG